MLFDVLVIGSGIAGMRAAVEASRYNQKVALMVKGNPLRSNSSMAAGGINASLSHTAGDTPNVHIDDTIKGGDGLCNPRAVRTLCEEAPGAIEELLEMDIPFDRDDSGNIAQRSFGGGGKKRTCYIADKTGAGIVQSLMIQSRKYGITWHRDQQVMNLLHQDGQICGVTALNKDNCTVMVYVAKAVVLAGGGCGGIYRGFTTNPQDTCGDTLAAAMRAGLRLKDMEFMQFHPTGLHKSGSLVSEAARGEGAFLLNCKNERFVNELETRDKVARAVATEISSGREVFLDIRHLGETFINDKLPSLRKACISSEGIDPLDATIPIKPVAHYSMGGIETHWDTSTKMRGLFACGENACNGVHGANRLGGNSLLEAVVFGKKAGEMAARYAQKSDYRSINYQTVAKDMNLVDDIMAGENRYNISSVRTNLGQSMYNHVGIFRDESSLGEAWDYIKYLRRLVYGLHCVNKSKEYNAELPAILELRNALIVSEAMICSATERKETRGSHCRTDYPGRDDKTFQKHTCIEEKQSGFLHISYEADGGVAEMKSRFRSFFRS